MIAADTNLVVRHLTHDDAKQTAAVERVFAAAAARGEPIFLGQIVLCEVCWTLSSWYRFERAAIVTALEALLGDDTFVIQGRTSVDKALVRYRKGKAGFPDYLLGEVAKEEGAGVTMTFDRKLSRTPGFELAK